MLDKIKQALRDKYIPYWARDVKIEDKIHSNLVAITKMKAVGGGNNNTNINNNKRPNPVPVNVFNPMVPWATAVAGMGNTNMFTPAARLAAINAANAGALAATNPNTNRNKNKNKLDFLFTSSAKRQLGQTSVVPTVDDILKCKVDQMPSFNRANNAIRPPNGAIATAANASIPFQSSMGLNGYQSMFPMSWMSASMGMGGMPGPVVGVPTAAHAYHGVTSDMTHGFGVGGNPGAPALPTNTMGSFAPSIGLLRSLDMKSLDNYMEQQVAGMSTTGMTMGVPTHAAQNANAAQSLDMLRSLVSNGGGVGGATAWGPAASVAKRPAMRATGTAAASTTDSMKTDWNAMYAKALSNPKPV